MTVKKGELVALYGRVGSGKTSLLSAIVGEMNKVEGTVQVHGRVAYAAQNPWIMSSSVRENITFFRKFDQTYYDLVLDGGSLTLDLPNDRPTDLSPIACALRQDISLLPDGDLTEVGEKGITLSVSKDRVSSPPVSLLSSQGGQRARVALARAVYARADLYLLDDVLAAVDAHVARHLFGMSKILLQRSTRTHLTSS